MKLPFVFKRIAALGLVPVLMVGSTGCVWRTEHKVETVSKIDAHIVLDIRQIKDEAASIEDAVRSEDEQAGAAKPVSWAHTNSMLRDLRNSSRGGIFRFSPTAAAAELPEVTKEQEQQAIQSRKARFKEIDAALSTGKLGENDRGYVEVLVPKDSPQRGALDALAKAENADRRTIYISLTRRQGGKAEDLPKVEAVYAVTIREQLKKGQTFQAPKDEGRFAEFQKSEVGRAHADAKPGQWVVKAIDPPKKN